MRNTFTNLFHNAEYQNQTRRITSSLTVKLHIRHVLVLK